MKPTTSSAPRRPPSERLRHRPTNESEAVIRLDALSFRYGEFLAVDHLDFEIRHGEIFALLGTNGAGKTTTLELIEGFRAPSSGTVQVLGLDPQRHRQALAARTGTMLQEAGLINELTAAETLRMWAGLSSRTDRVEAVLELIGLDDRQEVAVERLSGGERRRLDFGLAIWGRPQLIILDEPSTGLDPESRQRLWATVRSLREAGSTIVLTTHYLNEAQALADRVAIMHQGRIQVLGTMSELLARHPARIAATLPAASGVALPALQGQVDLAPTSEGLRLTVETKSLQADLAALLRWATDHHVVLADLSAANASLEEIFLRVGTS
ncbi:ABC transporter ATP-binding protein [Actinoalloteichus hymeniacidonis]|nr:ABC transporter ATP-binding protein [Actinoalloteichus hymeniacidonis]MBB5910574.1 ABC-2 type transport system ATP-binding protein [Actinoalloteichus hymeniacidonis]